MCVCVFGRNPIRDPKSSGPSRSSDARRVRVSDLLSPRACGGRTPAAAPPLAPKAPRGFPRGATRGAISLARRPNPPPLAPRKTSPPYPSAALPRRLQADLSAERHPRPSASARPAPPPRRPSPPCLALLPLRLF